MLRSMTGQGHARGQFGTAELSVDIRTVNNRHLKLHSRMSESLGGLEQQVESLVRKALRRGSVQLNVFLQGGESAGKYVVQQEVLQSYVEQFRAVASGLGVSDELRLTDLVELPGVVLEPRLNAQAAEEIDSELVEVILATVTAAVESLNEMRSAEGASIRAELLQQLKRVDELCDSIEQRAPQVIDEYRTRLTHRLNQALTEMEGELDEGVVVREVLLLADRIDIREEIVRLRSHLGQFTELLDGSESQGRKLDFLIQEMFREVNTIGSKASDASIAQFVVDMKTVIEQMREQIQNVE